MSKLLHKHLKAGHRYFNMTVIYEEDATHAVISEWRLRLCGTQNEAGYPVWGDTWNQDTTLFANVAFLPPDPHVWELAMVCLGFSPVPNEVLETYDDDEAAHKIKTVKNFCKMHSSEMLGQPWDPRPDAV